MKVSIRQEGTGDRRAVYEINSRAFGQENEARLVDRLRDRKAFIPELSLVAAIGSRLAGHILFSKIIIADEQHHELESLALAPMAVSPAFQRKGIGGQLIKSGLDKARALNYTSVIVLGHEHYYPKFGFVPADKWNIQSPYNVPANVFMALELVTDGLKGISGMVRYPEAFGAI